MKWWTEGNSPEAAPLGFWPQPAGSCLPSLVSTMGNSFVLLCHFRAHERDVNSATAAKDLKINAK